MRYFVWRFDETEPYRVYSFRRYVSPDVVGACIWRGDDYYDGLYVAKLANTELRKKRKESITKQMDLLKEH